MGIIDVQVQRGRTKEGFPNAKTTGAEHDARTLTKETLFNANASRKKTA